MIIRKLKNFAMLLAAGLLANAAFADETDADYIYSHFCEQNKDLPLGDIIVCDVKLSD